MDLYALEQLRKKNLFKLLFLNLLTTILLAAILYYGFYISNISDSIPLFTFPIIFYVFINQIPKNFEKDIKKQLLPLILKNFINKDDDILWQGTDSILPESTKDKVISELCQQISKQCTIKSDNKSPSELISNIKEREQLEQKEILTPQEKDRLQILNDKIHKEEEQTSLWIKEQYNIELKMLDNIEHTANYTNEDLIKIEYLKKEIKRYENREEESRLSDNYDKLTVVEKEQLNKIRQEMDDYYKEQKEEFEKSDKQFNRGFCLFDLFNTTVEYDDVFWGKYKNIDFLAIEGKNYKIFEGTVIQIPLKVDFNNTLFIQNTSNYITIAGNRQLKSGLQQVKLNDVFNKKYKIWASLPNDISTILDEKFIQYLNNSQNNFSYMFKENNAYLIWGHAKDFYKLGSLFKKIDDRKQYEKFEKDFRVLLHLIEEFASNNWAKAVELVSGANAI